uniref:Uncharacterized protein n=1 Tax=Romanomermis culicivorax TaxID=13658 RepID=A0A915J690_ROMCU
MVASAFLFALSEAFWISLMPYWLQHYFYMLMPGLTIAMFLFAYPVCVVVSVYRIKSNMAAHDRKKFLVEIKLLAQAVLVGCMLFLQEFLYQMTAGGLIYEIFYMFYGGLNPFIYLSLDVKIRRVYFKLMRLKLADNLITPTSKTAPQISNCRIVCLNEKIKLALEI